MYPILKFDYSGFFLHLVYLFIYLFLDIGPLSDVEMVKSFSPFCKLLFCTINGVFCSLIIYHLLILNLNALPIGVL